MKCVHCGRIIEQDIVGRYNCNCDDLVADEVVEDNVIIKNDTRKDINYKNDNTSNDCKVEIKLKDGNMYTIVVDEDMYFKIIEAFKDYKDNIIDAFASIHYNFRIEFKNVESIKKV